MLESTIERAVCRYARGRGWLAFKWVSPGHRGVPDRIFFRNGEVLLVEFKAPGRRPTRLQALIHQRLHNQGFPVHVIDSIDDGKALLR